MKEEVTVIEETLSIKHYYHVFVCSEEQRVDTLLVIKEIYPNEDIELTRSGYKVRVLRKKTEEEKQEWAQTHKPIPTKKMDTTWEQECSNVTKPSKGKKR